MKNRTITWLTNDCFVDCDLDVIKSLASTYNVKWVIILNRKKSRFNENDFEDLKLIPTLEISFAYTDYRERSLKTLFFYFSLLSSLIKTKADVFYINQVPTIYFSLIACIFLRRNKTIFTAHQGEVHGGFKHKYLYALSYGLVYNWFYNVNLFSQTQADKFVSKHPDSSVFLIPLALKEFGQSHKIKSVTQVTFFNFGTITERKGIDLLIDAACNLHKKGIRGFHVTIAGACNNWEPYEKRILYPNIFTCIIRPLLNSEIPDLFGENHYLVLPYKIVTQSGPLKIAYNYNVPVIASDNGSFREEITDGKTGYLFENESVEDLERVMKMAIDKHKSNYGDLQHRQMEMVASRYAFDSIIEKYKSMFHKVLTR